MNRHRWYAPVVAEGWSSREVELTVADYFAMLRAELMGEAYGKTAQRRELAPQLDGRSEQLIAFKHCNISAILVQMHVPYIDGYKPRGNYQQPLRERASSRSSFVIPASLPTSLRRRG